MRAAQEAQQQRKQQQEIAEMDAIYDRYVKPLEQEHLGEFVAVAPDGRLLLGASSRELTRQATEVFGPGNYFFKIGPRVVGRWR